MKFENLNDAFAYLRDGYSYSEVLVDCMNAANISKEELEALFTKWLWHDSEDFEYANDEDKAYAVTLGRVEEFLCIQGLIYNEE